MKKAIVAFVLVCLGSIVFGKDKTALTGLWMVEDAPLRIGYRIKHDNIKGIDQLICLIPYYGFKDINEIKINGDTITVNIYKKDYINNPEVSDKKDETLKLLSPFLDLETQTFEDDTKISIYLKYKFIDNKLYFNNCSDGLVSHPEIEKVLADSDKLLDKEEVVKVKMLEYLNSKFNKKYNDFYISDISRSTESSVWDFEILSKKRVFSHSFYADVNNLDLKSLDEQYYTGCIEEVLENELKKLLTAFPVSDFNISISGLNNLYNYPNSKLSVIEIINKNNYYINISLQIFKKNIGDSDLQKLFDIYLVYKKKFKGLSFIVSFYDTKETMLKREVYIPETDYPTTFKDFKRFYEK